MINFILGMLLGAIVGFIICACLCIAWEDDIDEK